MPTSRVGHHRPSTSRPLTPPAATLPRAARACPPACHRPLHRDHHRDADRADTYSGHHHRHRRLRLPLVLPALPGSSPGRPSSTPSPVVTPANQTDVSGTGHHHRGHHAPRTPRPGAGFTWSATDLPAGLGSLNWATGDITGTPTVAGTYPVTVTATDATGFSDGSAGFTWAIHTSTNAVSVTNPRAPSRARPACAITALGTKRRRHPVRAPRSPGRPPACPTGLVDRRRHRHHHGHADRRRHLRAWPSRPPTAPGLPGSASFTWAITGAVIVTNPG